MGQKVHPIGIRLGIIKDWTSKWYANSKDYADFLNKDIDKQRFIDAYTGLRNLFIRKDYLKEYDVEDEKTIEKQDKNVDKKCQTMVDGSYKATKEKYLSNITDSQLSNGLDAFYSNYENQNISTDKAVWIVLKTIHNDPEKEINELIKSWRKVTSP